MQLKIFNKKISFVIGSLVFLLLFSLMAGCTDQKVAEEAAPEQEKYKTITDMRGKEVKIPKDLKRVVTISDGLIESTMIIFGVEDSLVGVGSACIGKNFNYKFTTSTGENYSYVNGTNPALTLYPKIGELPLVMQAAINCETLASLNPDVVIIRLGCSRFISETNEKVKQTIERIDSLGIPLIVLRAPVCHDKPDLRTMYKEIEILGEIFNKQDKAREINNYLDKQVQFIKERTRDIKDEEKPKVLLLGLGENARKKGGAGSVMGMDRTECILIEELVNAKMAYRGTGAHTNIMSAEQILAMDPDVIILPTSMGYHPARELYEGEPFRNLQELKAVKEKRVYALPWTSCNWAIRLEGLVNLMIEAKAAYPERFADLEINEWVLEFYKQVYSVNDEMAEKIRSTQWLDWTVEEKF